MLLTGKLFAKGELKPDVKVAIAAQKLPTLGRVAAEKPTSSVA
jgi:hypothetical protein